MRAYLHRFKKKWNIRSNLQFWIIMLAFALTGSSILILKPHIFEILGINASMHWFPYALLYIIIIFPLYFSLLMFYGSMLGQYRFFSRFVLRYVKRG